jgi:hypothetical protein
MAARTSKAQARRLAAEARDRFTPRQLPVQLQSLLDGYEPQSVDAVTYAEVKPTVFEVMGRTSTQGKEKFRQQRNYVTQLAGWSQQRGLSLAIEELLSVSRISAFVTDSCAQLSDATRADKRSDLLELAQQVNPDYDGLPRTESIPRPRVKPPYTDAEVANIVRVARNQSTPTRRRQLCAVVGLGLGAGLDSTDIKPLRAKDINDHGAEGVTVEVGGRRPRTVTVRSAFEDLVREGVKGLRTNALILGEDAPRKNVTGQVIAQADIPSTAPHIEQSRLRATYLAVLIQQPIPILDVLEVAGLKSVQTLVDIAQYVRDQQAGRR